MKKTKLYIIDDNLELINSIQKIYEDDSEVEFIGYSQDGIDGVEKINTMLPDVIVLDIVVPNLDGYGILKGINYSLFPKKPNIIVVSQLIGDAFISKAINYGACYYMAKPVNLELLAERIREYGNNAEKPKQAGCIDDKFIQTAIKRSKHSLDEKIANIFISVGIPAHIKGYQFLREAIKMAIETPNIINSITKQLYPSIATHFNTSASKVERAIRHAIEVAWNRGKIENINTIFGLKIYTSNDKPTNGEFIALLADKMIMEGA